MKGEKKTPGRMQECVVSFLVRSHASLAGRNAAQGTLLATGRRPPTGKSSTWTAVVAVGLLLVLLLLLLVLVLGAKGEALGAIELGVSTELAHLTLARAFVLLVAHLHIVLWLAAHAVLVEEGRVATLEDVDIGVVQCRVTVHVQLAVPLAKM